MNDNFKVTLRRETFAEIKESADRNGIGLYRALKNYMLLHIFPYMIRGDFVKIVTLNETDNTVVVVLYLNYRLLTKAQETRGSVGLYGATRTAEKNPLGGTEPTAAD
jgi:hypothetical protein